MVYVWMFPKIRGTPKSFILINRVFHCKPSILGYHYFWKHPKRFFGSVCLSHSKKMQLQAPFVFGEQLFIDRMGHEVLVARGSSSDSKWISMFLLSICLNKTRTNFGDFWKVTLKKIRGTLDVIPCMKSGDYHAVGICGYSWHVWVI